MVEESKEEGKEKKKTEEKKEIKEERLAEQPRAEKKKVEEKKGKEKKEETKEEKARKIEAVVFGKDLPISTKHAVAICKFIRGKKIDEAVSLLGDVIQFKKAVPMKGELPHRKGKIMSGRYPIKASQQFIKLLRQLGANATINEIELENGRIECKADKAARPFRRFGDKRFKRSHVMLRLKIKEDERKKNKEEKTEENKQKEK